MARIAPAANGHHSQQAVTQSRLLTIPSETRAQIYKEVFCGLEVQLLHYSAVPRAYSTLVNICQVCPTFLLEARPIFLRTVTAIAFADVSPVNKVRRLSKEDCGSIRNLVIHVTKNSQTNYSTITQLMPNIEQLTIDLTPWYCGYLDVERAMKSKDTVIITGSDAEYDEDKRIGVNRLFATFEDWVRNFAIERASVNSTSRFKLFVRLDFKNELNDDTAMTIVKCNIDVLSRIATIEIPGCTDGILKLPVFIGRDLHPNATCEASV